MSSTSRIVTIVVTLVVIAAAVAFVAGRFKPWFKNTPLPLPSAKISPMFEAQTNTVQGTIVAVDNSKSITVKDFSGQTDTFPLAKMVIVNKFAKGAKIASGSTDLKTIELNKEAFIVFRVEDGEYKAVSITYLPPAPSVAGASAAAKPTLAQ